MALGLFTFNACNDDTEDPAPEEEPKTTYTADASVIINANCAVSGCHVSGAPVGSLEGYADAKAFAGFGRMLPAINHENGYSPMPKNQSKLSDADIAVMTKWVEDGLLE